jgi:hypothetical protein
MKEWKNLKAAAAASGIHRATLARWVSRGRLKSRTDRVRNLVATLVEMGAVRKIVAAGVGPGRPPKSIDGPRRKVRRAAVCGVRFRLD